MPAGDPAGYLPNVRRARRNRGGAAAPYRGRKPPRPRMNPAGGVQAPAGKTPVAPTNLAPMPRRRVGSAEIPPRFRGRKFIPKSMRRKVT